MKIQTNANMKKMQVKSLLNTKLIFYQNTNTLNTKFLRLSISKYLNIL